MNQAGGLWGSQRRVAPLVSHLDKMSCFVTEPYHLLTLLAVYGFAIASEQVHISLLLLDEDSQATRQSH